MHLCLFVLVIGVLNVLIGYAFGVYWRRELWSPRSAGALTAPQPIPGDAGNQVAAVEEPINESDQELTCCPNASLPADAQEICDPATQPRRHDLHTLRLFVDSATANLADLISRMKHDSWSQSGATAWSFVGELQGVCDPYLRHLNELAGELCGGAGSGAATALSDEIQETIVEQAAQLETTLSNLQYMDFASSFSTAMKRLQTDTANTLVLARGLQKVLETAHATTGEPAGSPCSG
jgi:hypothetical protein